MQVVTVDLQKEPDLAALVADKEPGDKITLHTSIRDLNEQTITLTITGCEEGPDDEDDEDEDDTPEEASAPTKEKSYGKKYSDEM